MGLQNLGQDFRLAYGLIAVGAVANADHDVAKFILDQVAVAAADDSVNLVEWLFLPAQAAR